MGCTEVDRHGRKRCHRCQLPFSWISSSRHKERFTRWDGSLGPSRKRFLSRGIVVVYSFIGNGNSKFPPGGIFSDSPPDLGPIFFSPVIVYRSDDNLIPIQFCRRWYRFRRISVRSTVVIIARGGRLICIPASRGMWRGNGARVSYSTSNSTGVVSFRQISPTTTTLITPTACIRFILPSIRNYESSLHFFHVPRFFSRRFTSCLALDPGSRFAASTERSLP